MIGSPRDWVTYDGVWKHASSLAIGYRAAYGNHPISTPPLFVSWRFEGTWVSMGDAAWSPFSIPGRGKWVDRDCEQGSGALISDRWWCRARRSSWRKVGKGDMFCCKTAAKWDAMASFGRKGASFICP